MTNDAAPDQPTLLVHAHVDGELDPANALAVERQIAADPALHAERTRTEALRKALREKFPVKPMPSHARARVMAAVGIDRGRARPSWRALAASVAFALLLGSGSTFLALRSAETDRVAAAVADGHMRALMASQQYDVASSDRHTVKPWFNGRIAQAPRVVDLAPEGFTLAGGRIDVIGSMPVATLVYHHRQHVISLSAVPAAGAAASQLRTIKGYNLVSWTDDGVAYWAVSDLGAADLETFARLFRSAPADR